MSKQRAIIKRMEIKGLWGRQDFVLDFHDDLNILTGSNGSGKTTILKVLWYIYSGNFIQIFSEINFSEISCIANTFTIRLICKISDTADADFRSGVPFPPETPLIGVSIEQNNGRVDMHWIAADEVAHRLSADYPVANGSGSLIFPTFRQIEGGFSLETDKRNIEIQQGIAAFALRMTRREHRFVMTLGVEDIRNSINAISSDIRLRLKPVEEAFMQFVSGPLRASATFNTELEKQVVAKQAAEAEITQPLTTLSRLIDELMLEKSVQITDELILGSHPIHVPLEGLSGGEKSLLSFIVYAMRKPGIMIIDEPELGLHQDWQRKFIWMMREISPETQYFIASHASPVRAAYPDKQIFLDEQIREV